MEMCRQRMHGDISHSRTWTQLHTDKGARNTQEHPAPSLCFAPAGALLCSSPSSSSSDTTLLSMALSLSVMLPSRPLALQ